MAQNKKGTNYVVNDKPNYINCQLFFFTGPTTVKAA
jgi:hypothetical protein